jgi:IS5 family transposase
MRIKIEAQLYFEFPSDATLKIVKEYEEKYNSIAKLFTDNPRILDLVHEDLKRLSTDTDKPYGVRGRSGTYTSENILRALIVQGVEGTDYRETIVRIALSPFLKQFLRLGHRDVMDYSFLGKCFKVIEPETWEQINQVLAKYAKREGLIDTSRIRMDTTLVETNIHYPTDSSLLWDSARVLARLLRRGRDIAPHKCPHRFHEKKIKKRHIAITRASLAQNPKGKKSKGRKRKIKRLFGRLIADIQRLTEIGERFAEYAVNCDEADLDLDAVLTLKGIGNELKECLPLIEHVIEQSTRAQLNGEKVPAAERIFSIFEAHTELVKRGKAHRPVEFGHMILVTQTKDKFITDFDAMEDRIPDCRLTEKGIERQKALFGVYPKVAAADTGFCADADTMAALKKKVKILAIPRRVADRCDDDLVPWHNFRAGVEGTISVLKRAFRLSRCLYKGFRSFAAGIGLGIFAHNLVVLSRLRI